MYENIFDLLKQIALGEDSVLGLKDMEFSGNKIIGPHRDRMADELAAMANTASGVIVLGVQEEKTILRIDVPRSLFVLKSPNGYFRQIGSSKREMKPEVLARLFQQRSQAWLIRFDEQTAPCARPSAVS